jgi:hypothetical protein
MDKVNYFDKRIKADLEDALNIMYWINKDEFRSMFGDEDKPPLLAIIAGIEKGTPIFFEKHYIIEHSNLTQFRIKIETFKPIRIPAVACIGTCDVMEQNEIIDPIRSIQKWITLQASATPISVGLPIDILRIAPNNVEWVQHPHCPKIKTEFFK